MTTNFSSCSVSGVNIPYTSSVHVLFRRTVNNNGKSRKMSQRYFCPAEYTTKTKPKTNQTTRRFATQWHLRRGTNLRPPNPKTNSKPNLSPFFFSFRFSLSVYSAGQKYRWLIFLVVVAVVSLVLSFCSSATHVLYDNVHLFLTPYSHSIEPSFLVCTIQFPGRQFLNLTHRMTCV